MVVLGLHGELHVTVPVGAWTCLDLRKVCCQRWGVTLPSTDMTQCRWRGNRGRLEDTKPLEQVVRWQRGDNKIYVSRVISAAPAEQHQAAPAEQQAAPAEQQRQVALEQAAPAEQQQAALQAAPAEQHTTNDGDTALLEHNRHRPQNNHSDKRPPDHEQGCVCHGRLSKEVCTMRCTMRLAGSRGKTVSAPVHEQGCVCHGRLSKEVCTMRLAGSRAPVPVPAGASVVSHGEGCDCNGRLSKQVCGVIRARELPLLLTSCYSPSLITHHSPLTTHLLTVIY